MTPPVVADVLLLLLVVVQVAPAWRQQADKLKEYGYYDALYVS